MARELKVKLGMDNASFKAKLRQSQNELNQFSSAIRNAFSFAGGELIVDGIKRGLESTVTEGLNFNDTIQQASTSFKTLLKSSADATEMVNDLWDLAADTPLEFPALLTAAKRMLAFKFAASEVDDMLITIGDASSSLGAGAEGVNRITTALGQMQAKNKVSAEEMMQLSEMGINAWDYLADALGKTTAETMKLSEKGLIPAEQAIQVILDGMRRDFGGGMQDLSKTYSGLMSTLKDTTSQTMGQVMKPLFDDLTNTVLPAAIAKVKEFGKGFQDGGLKGGIAGMFPEADVQRINKTIDNVTASFKVLLGIGMEAGEGLAEWGGIIASNWETVGPIITGVVAAWTAYKTAVTIAAAAQAVMNGLANANPYVLLASALIGVTAAVVGYNAVQGQMRSATIDSANAAAEEIEKTHELIDEYYDLKQATNLTTKEKEDLKSLEQQLISKVPESTRLINDQTLSYAQQRDVLEQLIVTKNKDALLAGKLTGEIALPGLQSQLEKLKAEEKKAREWLNKYNQDTTSGTFAGTARLWSDDLDKQNWSNKLANSINQRQAVEEEIEKAKTAIDAYKKYVSEAETSAATTKLVDKFLKDSKESASNLKKNTSETADETEDSAKNLRDAIKAFGTSGADYWKKINDSMNSFFSDIRSQRDELASFGSMFERNVIEKFSPEKIQSRLNRFKKQIDEWRESLASLSGKGVNSDLLEGLRAMGLSGAGIISGLDKMSTQQLAAAMGTISQIRGAATQEAAATVIYEHKIDLSGAVDVKGYTTDGQLDKIKQLAAAEVAEALANTDALPVDGTWKRGIVP